MKTIFTRLWMLILLSGCATQIKTYQDKDAKVEAFSTWCWLQGCEVTYQGPKEYYNKAVLDQIATSITNQLKFKGYKQKEDEPQLLVNFYLVIKQDEMQVQEPAFTGAPLNEQWLVNRHLDYVQFLKGSLVIDVINREKSALIWRTNIIKYLDLHARLDLEEIDQLIDKAMRQLPKRAR